MKDHDKSNALPVRGKQRIAVYHALQKPASGRQILKQAKAAAPSMTYQDLRHILRDFEKRGIAVCLNPQDQTGRFYVLAPEADEPLIPGEQLRLCAQVCRAKTRLAVLEEVAREHIYEKYPLTATEIRKRLRERCPLSLNHVIAALKFLREHRLVETAGYTKKRSLRIYRVTGLGKTVLGHLADAQQPSTSGKNPTR